MLAWIVKRYGNMKPVVIDGFLYVVIAVCGTILAVLTQEDAYKYVNPQVLYWGKLLDEAIGSGATALKMFRSTAYGEHVAAKKAASDLQTGNTTTITKADVSAAITNKLA